jgi:hypothetical protein
MVRVRLARFVRNHSRLAVAWAMLPLVLLNGRTITGCGCTGHFEAVCHCGCANGCGGCCGQNGVRSCCAKRLADGRGHSPATPPGSSERAGGRHCKEAGDYVVLPATVSPTLADDDSQASAAALMAVDGLIPTLTNHAGLIVPWDTRPPNDLVVVLHRLVI